MITQKGIDVSKWDLNMNWSAYDWDFAFIKCSEGTTPDKLFDYHWNNARGRTNRGPYHFFRGYVNPEYAVDRFIEYLDGDFGELPAQLDAEILDINVSVDTYRSRMLTWLIKYEQVTGDAPMIYSRIEFLFNTLKIHLFPDFQKYKLWIAQYPFDRMTVEKRTEFTRRVLEGEHNLLPIPVAPKPFVIDYYQWADKALPEWVPGCCTAKDCKKAVDVNFKLEYKEDDMSENIQEGTISQALLGTSAHLNIRDAASATARDLGNLYDGDKVYGVVTNSWMRFVKIVRKDGAIELFTGYASTLFMTLKDIPDDLPAPAPDQLPSYLTAHDKDGNVLGRYNIQS